MIPKEILIINQPVGNRGDESAHRALVRELNASLPNTHVTILSFADYVNGISEMAVNNPSNEYIRFVFPHNLMADKIAKVLMKLKLVRCGTLIHPILHRLLPYYHRADLVVCAPGGICMGGFQNWQHLYLLQLAYMMHKPVAYYSRSIGPFPEKTFLNRRFKSISTSLLRYFCFLSLRDRKSQSIATQMGIPFVSSVDTAFLEQPRVEIDKTVFGGLQANYVVFVPNELVWHYAYRDVSPELIRGFYLKILSLLRSEYPGHQIVMLPQLCSLPDSKSDYRYFRQLQKQDGGDDIFVMPDTFGSDIQQTIISRAQCVIGARYHTIVFSINNEVPFVALNYEHKIAGLLDELHLVGNMVDITRVFTSEEAVSHCVDEVTVVLRRVGHTRPKRDMAHENAKECFNRFMQTLIS